MDDWDIKKGEVYKKRGDWQKKGSETQVSKKKREVLNRDKKNIERGEWPM